MKYILFPVLFSFILACGTTKTKDEVAENPEILWDEMKLDPDTIAVGQSVRKVFHGSETVLSDLVHTKLEVSFDWSKSWLYGLATITAKPHFYPTDSLILDAKGMEIKSVKMGDQDLKFSYDKLQLKIKLDKTYTKNQPYTLKIDYISKPNERTTDGSAAITSDKGLYFINPTGEDKSIMPQIWTQGETESSSVWFPTIDSPNMKSTQETIITVDQKYVTLSNGKLMKSTNNANGTRTDQWKQDLAHAPYLFMLAVGEFKVVKDFYTRQDGSKMEVNYYVEPEWEPYAKAIFGETPAMIDFFSKLTGVEYVWDKYAQIVVRDYVSGAMENTGAVVFGEFTYKTDRELLDENDQSTIAHELFHHWFGDLVTCESWSNLPLNESFANYSQYLWDEHRFGTDQADYYAELEKDGYYSSSSDGGGHDLIWYNYDDKEQMFDGHSYNKGGRILHMLRTYLGDEAFFEGLKLYLKTNQFKAAEFHNLRLAFEEVSGKDLNWFFSQWFNASGHPVLNIEQQFSAENKDVKLSVFQNQDLSKTPLYQLPVQVMVYDDAGEHLHRINIDQVENYFTFPVEGKLQNVIFDYQQSTLGVITEDKPAEQYLHQYYHGKRYLARKNALLKGSESHSPEQEKMVLDALRDPFFELRSIAIQLAYALSDENMDRAVEIITEMVKNEEKPQVRGEAISFLAEKSDKVKFEALCLDRISNDKSYYVSGTALIELNKLNPALANQQAKTFENEPSAKMLSIVSSIYSLNGDETNFAFFENLMNNSKIRGYDAIICLNSFTRYIANQKIELQEKALSIYKVRYEKGDYYTKVFLPQNINHLITTIDERVNELNQKLEAYEKNKDFVEADKIRNVIKTNEAVLTELNMFLSQIESLQIDK